MVFSALGRLRYLYSAPPLGNFVFRLCYRWTTLLLIAFSLVITCRLWLGHSFSCVVADEEDAFPEDYVRVKCYDDTVYTLPTKLVVRRDESKFVEPSYEDFRRYQGYYPWVNLLFLVHAFNFYLPHLLWKSYERGYLRRLTAGVQAYFDREERRGLELCHLAKYVLVTQGRHRPYTMVYVSCELLNYLVSLFQTIWLVHFFDVTGVPDFLPYVLGTWQDFRNFYFPSEGICELKRLSPVAVTGVKALCQLPQNGLYMRMFLFLYGWYILVTVLCGLVLGYRVLLLVPSFRMLVSGISSPLAERSVVRSLCRGLSYGDWFFLTRLQEAMADVDFAQMVDKIAVVSQGKDAICGDEDRRFSLYEDATKEFENLSASSPV